MRYTTDTTQVQLWGNASDNMRRPLVDDPDEDLRRRQQEHLREVREINQTQASDCMHNGCSNCVGTGIGKDGRTCIHMISCPCGRCTPRF